MKNITNVCVLIAATEFQHHISVHSSCQMLALSYETLKTFLGKKIRMLCSSRGRKD